MDYRSNLVTGPTTEPLALSDLKNHLRVDSNDDDEYVQDLMQTARIMVEQYTNRALLTQTYDFYYDCFPAGDIIEIPIAPLQSVTHLKYINNSETLTTYSTDYYTVDTTGQCGRIIHDYDTAWPDVYGGRNQVQVRAVVGYTTSKNVPLPLRQAMMLIAGHLYENRENSLVNATAMKLPQGAEHLMRNYRARWY